ncbi:hypothetical protein GCM10027059_24050 [Myceligenerans halotolerans]
MPQAWHSPQRPTHFTVVQPHSVHAYAGLARLVVVVATRGTVPGVTDIDDGTRPGGFAVSKPAAERGRGAAARVAGQSPPGYGGRHRRRQPPDRAPAGE